MSQWAGSAPYIYTYIQGPTGKSVHTAATPELLGLQVYVCGRRQACSCLLLWDSGVPSIAHAKAFTAGGAAHKIAAYA